jgi:hypothetical protein
MTARSWFHSGMTVNATAALFSTVPVQPTAPQARLTMTAMPNAAASRPAPGSGPAAADTDPVIVTAASTVDTPVTAILAPATRLRAAGLQRTRQNWQF